MAELPKRPALPVQTTQQLPIMARSFDELVSKENKERMLTLISNGNTLKAAAKHQRIPFPLLNQLFKHAERELSNPSYNPKDYTDFELDLFDFYEAVEQAKARHEALLVDTVRDHAGEDWKAAQFLLRQANKEDWGDKPTTPPPPLHNTQDSNFQPRLGIDANGDALSSLFGTSNKLDLRLLTTEELLQLEALIKKATLNSV